MIHMAANSAPWENVAAYDRDLRRHMARHPLRSWGIILQQAWTVHIKDTGRNFRGETSRNERERTPNRKKDLCWRFNKGKCSYGLNCKFDHRCGVCNKFGHGAQSCRKLGLDRNSYPDKSDRMEKRQDKYRYYAPEKERKSLSTLKQEDRSK